MNLRLPAVIAVVAVAGTVAAVRTVHPPAQAAAFAATASPPVERVALLRVHSSAAPIVVVYVAGAVARAGVYRLASVARADDAVRAAGGATSAADLVAVNLAAHVADGDEIVVPEKGAPNDIVRGTTPGAATPRTGKHHKRHRKKHKRHARAARVAAESDVAEPERAADADDTTADAAPAAPVDVNSAGENELETLPGIGPGLAGRIVAFRELNGPFSAPDDLLDVSGMTQKKLETIEPFLH